MRICLVCTEKLPVPPVRGGAIQTYIDGVLPVISRHHRTTVVCRTDPALPEAEEAGGVRYVRLPAGRSPEEYLSATEAFVKTEAFDLVHVFNRPAFVPTLASAAGGAGITLSMHNDMFGPNRLDPALARQVLGQVVAVTAISDYIRDTIDRLHPGFAGKLRTIRSGVDLERFRPIWERRARRQLIRRRLGLLGKQVVLHVSRHSQKKGNHLVLEAIETVRRTHPQAHLLAVGSRWYGSDEDDDYTLALKQAALRMGTGVTLTGFIPPAQIPDLFLVGDLFVHASQWQEPLARVHYEAMAAGLPIITTDRGGNAEVIEEGVNGLIVRPHDDPAAFATQIRWLLDHPDMRRQMGERGRLRAEEHYSFGRVAQELLEVFAQCASS